MRRVSLFLVCLAVCTYTTYAFIGYEAGDLMMLQMMTGMFDGQMGAQPPQASGQGAQFGSQGQAPNVRRGGDLGFRNLMQMGLLSSMMI